MSKLIKPTLQGKMSKRLNSKRDENQIAASILNQITEAATQQPTKNPAAVALGRLGGLKGGKARAKNLSAKRRREIAQKAAKKRWDRK